MYKLALLAGIGAALIGTPAFADVSDLSTLYIYVAGGAPGGNITTTPGTSSANGKTASGRPTRERPQGFGQRQRNANRLQRVRQRAGKIELGRPD